MKSLYPKAKLSVLLDLFECQSEEQFMYYDRETGQSVMVDEIHLSALDDGDEEWIDDLSGWEEDMVEAARAVRDDDKGRFVRGPSRWEFHEYRHMQRFINTLEDPDAAGQLDDAIRGRGAFRYFKDTLYRLGLQDRWYRYRDAAIREFVIAWAEHHKIQWEDDTPE